MNSIVKKLPWKRYDNGLGVSASVGASLTYYAYKINPENSFFKTCLTGEDYDAWVDKFSTLEEAINACEAHYSKIILDGLSPEARAILEQHLNK